MEKYDFILSLVDQIGFWLTHAVAAWNSPSLAMSNAQAKLDGQAYYMDDDGNIIKPGSAED